MTVVAQTRFGPMLVPPHDSYVGRALIENGVYAPDEFAAWAPYLRPGDVVLEVGANLGAHTMAFSEAVGSEGMVIAVEPQRMLFAMLCGSQALQSRTNVWPRWCACGTAADVVLVPRLDTNVPNNFGGLPVQGHAAGEPVAQVPVDAWGMSRLDFLKIDVEGMELEVLQGAATTIGLSRPVIAVEVERKDRYPAILGWLLERQYRPFWQTPLLGPQWPDIRSKNLLCVPCEKGVPDPSGPGISQIAGIVLPEPLSV